MYEHQSFTMTASARIFLALAAVFGGMSVAAGAFGSHVLRDRLSERALEILKTGAQYQMYHALALLFVAVLLMALTPPPLPLKVSGYAFAIGIVLFSGSLYALALGNLSALALGIVTPFGGLALLAGWGCLLLTAWSAR